MNDYNRYSSVSDMLHNLSNSVIELVDSRCFMQQYTTQQHCLSRNVSYQQVIQPETIINTTILSPMHEPLPIKLHLSKSVKDWKHHIIESNNLQLFLSQLTNYRYIA